MKYIDPQTLCDAQHIHICNVLRLHLSNVGSDMFTLFKVIVRIAMQGIYMKQPRWKLLFSLLAFCMGVSSVPAAKPASAAKAAAEFPPGLFTDGHT